MEKLYRIAEIARELGKRVPANYGPKYEYVSEHGIRVFVDDYGHYATAHSKEGQLLGSTHPCERFMVSGNWSDALLALEGEANTKRNEREQARKKKRAAEEAQKMKPYDVAA